MSEIKEVTPKVLFDSAVHLGHPTHLWSPKMKPFIFGQQSGLHIIDPRQTLAGLDQAYSYIKRLGETSRTILFVGTKRSAREAVAENAIKCGMPYVNNRWLGGMLTNFITIRSRVNYMISIENREKTGELSVLPKKEQILLGKDLVKLQANLNGVRDMLKVPDAVFVCDTVEDSIAVAEAKRLGIPIIGILDTNSNPADVTIGIPGNDDAIAALNLYLGLAAQAYLEGHAHAKPIRHTGGGDLGTIGAENRGDLGTIDNLGTESFADMGAKPAKETLQEAASEAGYETFKAPSVKSK